MKRICCFIIALIMLVFMTACSSATVQTEKEAESPTSMFVIVEEANEWKIVYCKETQVMYVVSDGFYNKGTFTLLVNADGTPMLWTE